MAAVGGCSPARQPATGPWQPPYPCTQIDASIRSLGAGIVEFKRGLKGITDDVEVESNKPAALPKSESPKQIAPSGDQVTEA